MGSGARTGLSGSLDEGYDVNGPRMVLGPGQEARSLPPITLSGPGVLDYKTSPPCHYSVCLHLPQKTPTVDEVSCLSPFGTPPLLSVDFPTTNSCLASFTVVFAASEVFPVVLAGECVQVDSVALPHP